MSHAISAFCLAGVERLVGALNQKLSTVRDVLEGRNSEACGHWDAKPCLRGYCGSQALRGQSRSVDVRLGQNCDELFASIPGNQIRRPETSPKMWPTAISAASPAGCPNVSLYCLKRSKSTRTTDSGW